MPKNIKPVPFAAIESRIHLIRGSKVMLDTDLAELYSVTTGSYQAVKRFVRHLRETQPIPFVRMEVEPGAEAQVDFGQGAWVVVDGKRKRPHFFRVVLSHSRKGYSEVVWRQTTECNWHKANRVRVYSPTNRDNSPTAR